MITIALTLIIMIVSIMLYVNGQAEWAYVIQLIAFSVAMFDNANMYRK